MNWKALLRGAVAVGVTTAFLIVTTTFALQGEEWARNAILAAAGAVFLWLGFKPKDEI